MLEGCERKAACVMRVLAIDPGTLCGWALGTCEADVMVGHWTLRPSRYESSGMKYVKFANSLAELLDGEATRPDLVLYEEVRKHKGVDAAHAYGGFTAVLQQECIARKIEYGTMTVGEIKRHVTGIGNAKKKLVQQAIMAMYPRVMVKTDDEADALAIWSLGVKTYGRAVQ